MKLVPSFILGDGTLADRDKVSRAEKEIFHLLKKFNVGRNDIVLHSLNLTNYHKTRQKWHEIDFLILSTRGWLVLEVKGGTVKCRDGVWRYSGKEPTRQSPAVQAKNNYFALKDEYLSPRFGKRVKDCVSGFACIFPETDRFMSANESALCEQGDEITAYQDEAYSEATLKSFLNRVFQHFQTSSPSSRGLSEEDVEEIAAFLRPAFEKAPSLNTSLRYVKDELQSFTEEQYGALRFIEGLPRYMILGGAGTGKSFLAFYAARRHAALGKRTALLTRNPNLAAYAKQELAKSDVTVVTLAELAEGSPSEKFDALVMDEGQDLCTWETIDQVDNWLKDGVEAGEWNWFGDPNNQVSTSVPFDPEVYQCFEDFALHVPPALGENVRNASRVVESLMNFTHADVGSPKVRGTNGEVTISRAEDVSSACKEAIEKLKHWFQEENVQPSDVAVLVPGPAQIALAESVVKAADVPYQRLDRQVLSNAALLSKVIVADVEEFKGLERPCVVLLGFWEALDNQDSPSLQSLLYKGISRANHTTFIVATTKLNQALQSLVASSLTSSTSE